MITLDEFKEKYNANKISLQRIDQCLSIAASRGECRVYFKELDYETVLLLDERGWSIDKFFNRATGEYMTVVYIDELINGYRKDNFISESHKMLSDEVASRVEFAKQEVILSKNI